MSGRDGLPPLALDILVAAPPKRRPWGHGSPQGAVAVLYFDMPSMITSTPVVIFRRRCGGVSNGGRVCSVDLFVFSFQLGFISRMLAAGTASEEVAPQAVSLKP